MIFVRNLLNSINSNYPLLTAAILAALFMPNQLLSQENKDIETEQDRYSETITVTTQKRVQNIQEVPITITAFSGNEMTDMGIGNISDIGEFIPGVETRNTSPTQPSYNIRGIRTNDFGIGTDPAVGVYVDGIYIGRSGSAQINFNDIERVEVIKGPQGTLFGRNSAAGAISIITKKPVDADELALRLTVGDYNKIRAEVSGNYSLDDNLFLRASFFTNQQDGFIKASGTGRNLGAQENTSARLNLLWQASDETEVIWRADYDDTTNGARPTVSMNTSISPADPFGDYSTDIEDHEDRDLFGTSLEINHQLDGMIFTSITSYREFTSNNLQEEDGSDNTRFFFATENREDQDQISQEFRLTSDNDSSFRWVTGLSYFQESGSQQHHANFTTDTLDTFMLVDAGVPGEIVPFIPAGTGLTGFLLAALPTEMQMIGYALGIPPEQAANMIAQVNLGRPWNEETDNDLDFQSFAWYGDSTWQVNDAFELTFGLRYTKDTKDFSIFSEYQNGIIIPIPGVEPVPFGFAFFDEISPASKQSNEWSSWTPRFVASYKLNDDLMTYFSAAKGFKAGGFNSLGVDPAFDEEEVLNYELGVKSSWLENRLRLNASVYQYDYDNLQILKLSGPPGSVPTYNIRNADASGNGFEIELSWSVTDDFNLQASYGHVETKYESYTLFPGETEENDLTGQPLSSMPENTYHLSAIYYLSLDDMGDLDFRLDYSWFDDRTDGSGIQRPTSIDSYDNLNGRITWMNPAQSIAVAVYGTNLTDVERMTSYGGSASVVGSPSASRNKPMMYGLELSLFF